MPYPNEHACRLKQPSEFQKGSFRRMNRDHDGKKYSVIIGKLKGETKTTEQAYRYPKDTWSASSARSHCKSHDGSFEAASEGNSMEDKREVRTVHFTVEHREDGKPSKIVGHAAVFNEETNIAGIFKEKVARGAFSESIGEDDVRALFNHDSNHVLGRNKAGTLRMKEDSKGLAIEIDPPDTQFARDLMTSMERGDIDQMSFGFQVIKDSWVRGGEKELDTRTLEQVRLFDVSPVTFPAYEGTDVAVRSRDAALPEKPKGLAKRARRKLNIKLTPRERKEMK